LCGFVSDLETTKAKEDGDCQWTSEQ